MINKKVIITTRRDTGKTSFMGFKIWEKVIHEIEIPLFESVKEAIETNGENLVLQFINEARQRHFSNKWRSENR